MRLLSEVAERYLIIVVAILICVLVGCGSSPIASFREFIDSEKVETRHEGWIKGSETLDVSKSDSLSNPYIGKYEYDAEEVVVSENGPVKMKRKTYWEFIYKGDGKQWDLDQAFVTTKAIQILEDPQKFGPALQKSVGKRHRIK